MPAAPDLHSLVIRTHYSDETAWARVRTTLETQTGPFRANLVFVDDRRYDSLTIARLLEIVPRDSPDHGFVFLVDRETLAHPEYPVLVVNLADDGRGRHFRVIPPAIWSVQNNLIIANMDWEDFTSELDADGIYRGF